MSTLLMRLKLSFNNKTYATEERQTEIDIGGEDNEPVMDEAGNTHHMGKLNPGMIKCTLLATEGFKLREVQEMKKGNIVANGNNGLNFIMRNGRCGSARTFAGGKIAATFYGDVEEL